jgi:hypothetical protein
LAVSKDRDDLLHRLSGGDRRSIGRAAEAAAETRRRPNLAALLVRGMSHEDPVVRMRSADALEKASRTDAALLTPYAGQLLRLTEAAAQKEVRWHLAQMLPRLALTPKQRQRAERWLWDRLEDSSAIVRVCAMQSLTEMALLDPRLRAQWTPALQALVETGGSSVRARARKLLPLLRTAAVSGARRD